MQTTVFIRRNGIQALKDLGISVFEYPDRWVLDYDTVLSRPLKYHPVVRECRGLVLDKSLQVLCRSFDRFFNYGEDPQSALFDFSSSIAEEKPDGSLVNFYHDGEAWHCATRGAAFAEKEIWGSGGKTFLNLVESALGQHVALALKRADARFTYAFELVSPHNRVVIPYDREELIALTARDRHTGEESPDAVGELAKRIGARRLKQTQFSSLDEARNSFVVSDQLQEGYVFRNGNWRIKVKDPAYVALSHFRPNGHLPVRNMLKLVLRGEAAEHLVYFPEDSRLVGPYDAAFRRVLADVEKAMKRHKGCPSRVEFARAVEDLPCSGVVFMVYDGKTFTEAVQNLTLPGFRRLLEHYMELDGVKPPAEYAGVA